MRVIVAQEHDLPQLRSLCAFLCVALASLTRPARYKKRAAAAASSPKCYRSEVFLMDKWFRSSWQGCLADGSRCFGRVGSFCVDVETVDLRLSVVKLDPLDPDRLLHVLSNLD